jgi:hypothetical protein
MPRMESTVRNAPASGRQPARVTALRPLDRNHALTAVRRARTHVDGGRFTRQAIEERTRRFSYLKKVYD